MSPIKVSHYEEFSVLNLIKVIMGDAEITCLFSD
jgi:hypothetical protein